MFSLLALLVLVAVMPLTAPSAFRTGQAGAFSQPFACNDDATKAGTPPQGAGDGSAPTTVEIASHDLAFVPCWVEVAAAADGRVSLVLRNRGSAVHGFAIPELGVREQTAPGEERTIAFEAPPGRYGYLSDLPGHEAAGMTGTLVVVDDTAAAEPEDAPALVARFPALADGTGALGLATATLAPGAEIGAAAQDVTGALLLSVESGGPAAAYLRGPATVILPGGPGEEIGGLGGWSVFGPLAGIAIPAGTEFRLRNDGAEPLVLLWVAVEGDGATRLSTKVNGAGGGVTVRVLAETGPLPSTGEPFAIEVRREGDVAAASRALSSDLLRLVAPIAGSVGEVEWGAVSVSVTPLDGPPATPVGPGS